MNRQTHEQTINDALGEVLQSLGKQWDVLTEDLSALIDGGRPDVLVTTSAGWPIVVEAEVESHHEAEQDATGRLGEQPAATIEEIRTAIALVYPEELRRYSGRTLRNALREVELEYTLFTSGPSDAVIRWPEAGWLSGDIQDLALLLHRSTIPGWRVERLADVFEQGVNQAATILSNRHPYGSSLGESIAEVLGQMDDEDGQTRRMAMAVIINALMFHSALADAAVRVPLSLSGDNEDETEGHRAVQPVGAVLFGQEVSGCTPTPLVREWRHILEVDYWPIFHTASELVEQFPAKTGSTVLSVLWKTAEQLITGGVTRSHDLTGMVFQRLIADRKFLATFYTRPAAATMLAALAMPHQSALAEVDWSDSDTIASLRIGDFACGTGTLLSTAYQRVGVLHEVHGGDPSEFHPRMMARGLVGLDVLNIAVHLTAAILAGSYPETPFEGECLLTMPYGEYEWGVSVGSLELLEAQTSFDVIRSAAYTAGGRGEREVRDIVDRVGHREFDLVIMNPPFTRHGAREGARGEVHNPAFAAFGADEDVQDALSARTRSLAENGCAHGHAGLASYFVELAHRKVAEDGTVALVLPLSAMSGKSWSKVRQAFAAEFNSIRVVTIGASGTHSRSFSADTGMAECLLTARKVERDRVDGRAIFIVLNDRPRSALQGQQFADAVTDQIEAGSIRRLEDGPFGGTRITLGEETVAEALDCPLPEDDLAWQMVGISDVSLAQTAEQLTEGRLWIEGMREESVAEIPITTIDDISDGTGPHHLDITGGRIKADGLPQGPFEKIEESPGDGASYPSLWNHDASRERRLIVEPDSKLQVRSVDGRVPEQLRQRAERRAETATRVHFNHDLQFNSQSLVVAMTEERTIGGRAWPSIIFSDVRYEVPFSVWCNSSLGLLCYWWCANKTQDGRGTVTLSMMPTVPILNIERLSADQIAQTQVIFDDLKGRRFLPFNQMDEDPVRSEIDRRLIVEVLCLSEELCREGGPIDRLRRKLASEPQIQGGKKSRLVFTEDGERNERLSD